MSLYRPSRSLLLALAALLALSFAAPADAGGGPIIRTRSSGKSMFMEAYTYDSCSFTRVYIEATDGRVKTEGKPDTSRVLLGTIEQLNYCLDSTFYGSMYRELDASELQIDKQLGSATLNTSVDAVDFYDEATPVQINVTLTATDEPYRERSRFQTLSRHYRYLGRYDGTTRSALASGTVTLPWETITVGDGYTTLRSIKSSTMEIYKN